MLDSQVVYLIIKTKCTRFKTKLLLYYSFYTYTYKNFYMILNKLRSNNEDAICIIYVQHTQGKN